MKLALVALLALGPAAVAAAGEAPPLRVGTSGDYAPFSRDGEGFDVEVARLLARALGRPLEWVPFRWSELTESVEAGAFDVAMSGVTWRPEREGRGWLTRAVARGGPCVLRAGASEPGPIGVNRGGFLEGWARGRFGPEALLAVDDNLSLPALLARGEVAAIVTDSFELTHFRRAGWTAQCEPPRERKVYWVTPSASDLGPRIDAWLAKREPELRDLRQHHFGATSMLEDLDHVVDLMGRRLGLMPHVGAWKRQVGAAIEDPAREAVVLAEVGAVAAKLGLDPDSVRALFRVQIELAKRVQRRSPLPHTMLDLRRNLRPAISQLGDRIVHALAQVAPLEVEPASARFSLLDGLLQPDEIDRLRSALAGVQVSGAR